MTTLSIKYESISKTEGMEKRIIDKINKVTKFLKDGSKISISLKDNTPHKKTSGPEYEVIIDVTNVENSKNNLYAVSHKASDMYQCIDKTVKILFERLRRHHEKSVDRFNTYKDILQKQSKNEFKRIERSIKSVLNNEEF